MGSMTEPRKIALIVGNAIGLIVLLLAIFQLGTSIGFAPGWQLSTAGNLFFAEGWNPYYDRAISYALLSFCFLVVWLASQPKL